MKGLEVEALKKVDAMSENMTSTPQQTNPGEEDLWEESLSKLQLQRTSTHNSVRSTSQQTAAASAPRKKSSILSRFTSKLHEKRGKDLEQK